MTVKEALEIVKNRALAKAEAYSKIIDRWDKEGGSIRLHQEWVHLRIENKNIAEWCQNEINGIESKDDE